MKRAVTTSLLLMILAFSAPAPAAAIDSFFDVFTELSVVGPPYPMAPLITIVGENFGGSFQPQQEYEVSIASVSLNGLPPGIPVLAGPGDIVPGSPPSISSFFDVCYDITVTAPTVGRYSRTHIIHPPGTPPPNYCRLLPINPAAPPGSAASFFDIFVEDSFFDITYRVADDGGYHEYHVHSMSPSTRMSFFDVFIELHDTTPDAAGTVDSFFDVFVDFSLAPPVLTCPPFCSNPTDDCSLTSAFRVSNPVPVVPTTWTGIKNLLD